MIAFANLQKHEQQLIQNKFGAGSAKATFVVSESRAVPSGIASYLGSVNVPCNSQTAVANEKEYHVYIPHSDVAHCDVLLKENGTLKKSERDLQSSRAKL